MGLKSANPLFFYSWVVASAFMGLSSSAYSQNRPAPSQTQIWADPGAIEKARNEAGTEGRNQISAPSPAAPAFSGNATERLSAPSILKPTKNLQISSNVGVDRVHKLSHGPVKHAVAYPNKHHEILANHASSFGQASAFATGHKFPAAMGHTDNAPRFQSIPTNAALRHEPPVRAQNVRKAGLMSEKDAAATATDAEFDPIYGYENINRYSNTVSVSY